ncbi:MAG: hypothetical protein R3B70_43770 [Polyangiaceae bacterium]
MEEIIDPDGLDIDALLPATFDTSAARVVMGPDLAELLRLAEERTEAREEPSRPADSSMEGDDVPVPDDVLSLLAEPLESDEEDAGTGASAGSHAGTGAERPATLDGLLPTPHGHEEDLEEPLPRLSDIPRETTLARNTTGAGRDSAPPYEPARTAGTRPGTGEHLLRADPAPPVTAERRDRSFTDIPLPVVDRPATSARNEVTAERGAPSMDRSFAADPRPAVSDPRGFAGDTRGAVGEGRGFVGDARGAVGEGRGFVGDGRGFVGEGRGFVGDGRGGLPERHPYEERVAPQDRSPLVARPQVKPPERAPVVDRLAPGRMVSPHAVEPGDAGPRSRGLRTDAMPAVLGPGDAARALGRSVASRVSGALLITVGDDQRRIVLHDGDIVTAGSSAPVESLVAFLASRGDIERELLPRLAGKLPAFGRHAGAALVAHGYLGQDDLWPVLRAHAEWVIGLALLVEVGTCELEHDPPARYKAEPSVFGGATGAEVLVDIIQRVITPEAALERLGGYGARLASGPRAALLGECALSVEDEEAVRAAPGRTVHELTGDGPSGRWSLLHALSCLEIVDVLPAVAPEEKREEPRADPLDDEAIRARVRARLSLVEEGDYFALLGVSRGATSYEIRRAYLDLRRTLEPTRLLTATTVDLSDDLRLVLEVIEEAYQILRDTPRRERYRRAIEAGPPR